ncbi:hypothetical protein GCM10009039_26670 [Halocalculus aciditolerans]|uniref:Uncharacterized protein n=1 Tax=Halocalculus aciditolerans TaxID=1383812 RepID=A0A830FLE9_9EURY|nr:hypothetical protein GCM10009039_26670 [Halocalculus aciditolerans]
MRVSLTHKDAPNFPRDNNDSVSDYVVDMENSDMMVYPFVSADLVTSFITDNVLVDVPGGGYHEAGKGAFGTSNKRAELGGGSAVLLSRNYKSPQPVIRESSGGVQVSVDGGSYSVEAGSSNEIELDPRTVHTKTNGKKKKEKSTSITPVVHVQNYGRLDVRRFKEGQ